jgi:hypothetical protein
MLNKVCSFLWKPACRINPLMALQFARKRGGTSGLPEESRISQTGIGYCQIENGERTSGLKQESRLIRMPKTQMPAP